MSIRLFLAFIKGKWRQAFLYVLVVFFIASAAFSGVLFYYVMQLAQSGGVFDYCVRAISEDTVEGIGGDELRRLLEYPLIDGYDSRKIYEAELLNIQEADGMVFELQANINILYSDGFRQKTLLLSEGVFPSADCPGMVMEKETAENFHIGLGEKICLMVKEDDQINRLELSVIGFYEDMYHSGFDRESGSRCRLFTDFASIGRGADGTPLDYVDFYTADKESVSKIIHYVSMSVSDQITVSEATDFAFLILNRSVEKNAKYIGWMLGTLLGAGIVLLILFTLYMQHRNLYETAILICIGKARRDILFLTLGQTAFQALTAVLAALAGVMALSDRMLAYWTSLFTRNYKEGSISYTFTHEAGAILSQADYTTVNRLLLIAGFLIFFIAVTIAAAFQTYVLTRKAKDTVDKAI